MKPWTFSAATFTVAALGLLLFPAGAVGQRKPSCAAGKTGKPAAVPDLYGPSADEGSM